MLTSFLVVSNKKTLCNLLLSWKIAYDALNICDPRNGIAGSMAVVIPSHVILGSSPPSKYLILLIYLDAS